MTGVKNDEETEDDTSPDHMEECVSDINVDKNEKNYKEKEAECIDDTLPDEMEEGVNDRNENKNENDDEIKNEGETKDSDSITIDEGKGVIIEIGGKDVDLYEVDASTCSGDRFNDIFDKEENPFQ